MDIGFTCYHGFIVAALKASEAEYFRTYDRYRGDHNPPGAPVPIRVPNPVPDPQSEMVDAVEEAKIVLIFLATAYIESLVNLYLSLKLSQVDFLREEGKSLLKKWTVVLSSLLPSYDLQKTGSFYGDLKSLVERRN